MKLKVLIAVATLSIGAAPAFAQNQARSLDELLRLVEQGRAQDSREAQQREREFAQERSEQQRLLREAQETLQAETNRSQQLEASFEENEQEIAELTEELNQSLGDLRELFGVLQQVAGDTRAQFENSLTSVQYPDRGEFLSELAQRVGQGSRLASIEDLERLWFELQREATALGEVARVNTQIITDEGETVDSEIVRVGAFNLVTDGAYLDYSWDDAADEPVVAEFVRQPEQGRFINSTTDIMQAQEGPVKFGLDPTRGQILGLLVEQPNLRERIDQGGIVGYVIIALGLIGLLIALVQGLILVGVGAKVKSQLKSETANTNNPLGRVLSVYENNRSVDTETLELKLGEAIIKEVPPLQRGLLFIKIISVVAPLLGLLGTVTGMIKTFQAITLFGTGDPKLMAGGISQALVTTVLGLTVAIPMVLLHTIVSGRSKKILQVLQEQSAGIVAEHSEKHGGAA
jgi:biopolymer transport protein ExbB